MRCKVCGESFFMITQTHLRLHGLTPRQYVAQYPGTSMYDEEAKRKIIVTRHRVARARCQNPGCEAFVTRTWNKYCSRSCALSHRMSKDGRNEQAGVNNPHSTNSAWYSIGKRARAAARRRDDYTCQKCGRRDRGKGTHAHHKIPEDCFDVPEQAHALANLVTLCVSCHHQVEWETIREMFRRAQRLDTMLEGDAAHVPLSAFVESLFVKEGA